MPFSYHDDFVILASEEIGETLGENIVAPYTERDTGKTYDGQTLRVHIQDLCAQIH